MHLICPFFQRRWSSELVPRFRASSRLLKALRGDACDVGVDGIRVRVPLTVSTRRGGELLAAGGAGTDDFRFEARGPRQDAP